MRNKLLLFALLVPAIAFCILLANPASTLAQDNKQQEMIEMHRNQNRVRSLKGSIDALKKELETRYAKKKTSRVYDKKAGKMNETEIVDRKQPTLYDKATQIVIPWLEKDFEEEKDITAQIEKGETLEAFLQHMKKIFGSDTEKLEKKLKKEEDPQTLYDLILAA